MKPKVLFRVDGNERVGAGHVMRSLAIAERLVADGAQIEFVCRRLPAGLGAKIAAQCIQVHLVACEAGPGDDCRQLLEIAAAREAAWIVLDGYELAAGYRQAIYRSGRQLLVVDDLGRDEFYSADLLLNPGFRAEQLGYRHPAGTRSLLGLQYAPVANCFSAAQAARSAPARATRLLATFGGADPAELSSRFLEALALIDRPDLECRLVVGPANPRQEALRRQRDALAVRCELVVDPDAMVREMQWCDMAVAAAGSTCWELTRLGVPSLLIVAADNQHSVAAGLADAGAAINLGCGLELTPQSLAHESVALLDDPRRRRQMSEGGPKLVDGHGTARIARALFESTMQLVPVTHQRARLLFDWANDETARAMSFSQPPLVWDEHCHWLAERLRQPDQCVFWLACDAHGDPLGQVRYDLHEIEAPEAVVSISVAQQHRGQGIGRRLLELSARRLFSERNVRRIHAFARPENERSCRALLAAGYRETAAATVRDQPARHFVLARE